MWSFEILVGSPQVFYTKTKNDSNVYKMAQLIQELSKDKDSPLNYTTFFVIRSVMNAQNCTF